ncbi:MAG: NAD-dependent epimerase/dehydratase family protein [Erythrobacter sp.]|uniref:NAD-dependent epimerase/dehydratase family protein n=1 Tax=Erythrobacter sp. HL-111 TaxID=1798193 RepID=UPI0006DA1B85|nr:NAD-dependent epimerase/dehydratase family protein [Erythrobacter sp. HL-111]KPP81860.1 MAG: nucleoside-diphosphate-sugar epimerase [Erythrobacteraceae bacterium HL-111]SDR83110.1 Nucleoside-diphosphate-sugar epimerase [Erythrobacter sp. HL-111]
MAETVLVTGGTGFIAGEIIDLLLGAGKTVHTTVRNRTSNEPRLQDRWRTAGERLRVFEADLENDAGWAEAMEECDAVAHVASPFPMSTPRHPDELVKPARAGALRALECAKKAGVTRFVLTSSAAAIAYGHPPGRDRFDESDWTVLENPEVPAYHRSKTVAEKASREWMAQNGEGMTFCSINPVAVLGPVHDEDLSTSIELVRKLLTGEIPALPDAGFGIVDVRDVALAHVRALDAPAETVRGERFAVSDKFLWMQDIAGVLRERVPDLAGKVPSRRLPSIVVKLLAPFMADIRQVKTELGRHRDVSGAHARQALGIDYISAEDSIEATARSLADKGIVTPS